ncbi:maleate cis-trans isomerase family protein [Nocardioides luteus]|uniref:maleate cis-trans isomerase family protein n=1 Tax=Nocardioides luteus TaxID=1844 RepID=UPI0018C8F7B3|nr:aspartate/glutamate racemase family protein [Nocardioides luteus]MBG6097074.1 maleate isomerase [Nocardioides luteus]
MSPTVRIAVVVPHDMVLDHELWRWAPPDTSLLFTRTPYTDRAVTLEMAEEISETTVVEQAVRDLSAAQPHAYVYACTSGSFVHGRHGERRLTAAMHRAGGAPAVTTSGAVLESLATLNVSRVAVATPYDAALAARFGSFLAEAGITVVSAGDLGLGHHIWEVPYETTLELVRAADSHAAEAVVVSCTNLATYDIIGRLEAELGKPVVSANRATMEVALRMVGRTPPSTENLWGHAS